jgi:hypothetical protein
MRAMSRSVSGRYAPPDSPGRTAGEHRALRLSARRAARVTRLTGGPDVIIKMVPVWGMDAAGVEAWRDAQASVNELMKIYSFNNVDQVFAFKYY